MSFFGFLSNTFTSSDNAIKEIFPLDIPKTEFISHDIFFTYSMILTDVIERTGGVPDNIQELFFDSAVMSDASKGLISLLADAMENQKELFLVYNKSVSVLRCATQDEITKIRSDYKERGYSDTGVFVSFKNYRRTKLLKIYSAFEYYLLSALNKTLNLSKAVQIKINDLRASVSLSDSAVAQQQAQSIANALTAGKDIYLDRNDDVVTASPDTSTTEKAMSFLDGKRAFILNLPLSYINGEQTSGIGSTGESDMRAIERGLKQYYVSIIKPVLKSLFGLNTKFKSQDFRQITTALEIVKTFDLVPDGYISQESRGEIVARSFDLDAKEEAKKIKNERNSLSVD